MIFESKYREYIEIVSGKVSDPAVLMNSSLIYSTLEKEAFKLYDVINDKEHWIKSELSSLTNDRINVAVPIENEIFRRVYEGSFLRFELIDDYISEKQINLDIISELYDIYFFYNNKKKLYKVFHILCSFITHNVPSEDCYNLIILLFTFYFNDNNQYEDKTCIYRISIFLKEKFSQQKINNIVSNFPEFRTYL